MKNQFPILVIVGILLLLSGGMQIAATEKPPVIASDITLQKDAKKAIYDKDWEQACQLLHQLENRFPFSNYRPESIYWLGYCRDKQDRKIIAIEHLNRLIKTFNQSQWLDDAKILRLRIAADLVQQGQNQFRSYITEVVHSNIQSESELKLTAFDALLRIDKPQALPLLEQFYKDSKNPEIRENIIFMLRRFGEDKVITQLSQPDTINGTITLKEIKNAHIYPNKRIPTPKLIHQVDAVYPREALEERITGDVVLLVIIDKKGYVQYAVPIKGAHPFLAEAASKAVKQWKFFPYTKKGKRLDVVCTVTLCFGLE